MQLLDLKIYINQYTVVLYFKMVISAIIANSLDKLIYYLLLLINLGQYGPPQSFSSVSMQRLKGQS